MENNQDESLFENYDAYGSFFFNHTEKSNSKPSFQNEEIEMYHKNIIPFQKESINSCKNKESARQCRRRKKYMIN